MVVVDEKEKRIKESWRMVGLRDSAFWLSWFLVYAVLISCTSLIASILVNFVIFNTTSTYYWILLPLMLTFGLSIIMFAFMLTAMFSKAKTAGVVGGLSMTLVACLYYLQILKYDITGVNMSWDVIWSTEVSGLPIA